MAAERAYGFVLGIETVKALPPETISSLYMGRCHLRRSHQGALGKVDRRLVGSGYPQLIKARGIALAH